VAERRNADLVVSDFRFRPLADFDDSFTVDLRDLAAFAPHWLGGGCDDPLLPCCQPDLTGDGAVDLRDLLELTRTWLIVLPAP